MLQQLEILSELYLGQVKLVDILGPKLGLYAKLKGNLVNTLYAAFLTWSCWNYSECLSWYYVGQDWILVMSVQKLGH